MDYDSYMAELDKQRVQTRENVKARIAILQEEVQNLQTAIAALQIDYARLGGND